METSYAKRWAAGIVSVTGLVAIFVFQRTDIAALLDWTSVPVYKFIINRTIRFFLNDLFALLLLYALFHERKYILFGVYVQVVGVILFLIPYFVLKLYWPTYNGPMISFLHRLIMNPTTLLLLIPAFYYQKSLYQRNRP
jgi:exosortase F-associated protein